MKPASFDYVRADSVTAAARALAADPGETTVLAGGQSLMPMMNMRIARPSTLVDIGGLAELRQVREERAGVLFGALTTHADIEDGRVADPAGGMLRCVAAGIAYRAVRNVGTVGGSVAHADPAADWPAALLALGAWVHLAGDDSSARRLAIDDFLSEPFETAREPGEVVTAIEVPALADGARWRYAKSCRKAGEFAEALAAVVLEPERGRARVVVGATGSRPVLLAGLAERLAGGTAPDRDGCAEAIAAAAPELDRLVLRRQAALLSRTLAEVAGHG